MPSLALFFMTGIAAIFDPVRVRLSGFEFYDSPPDYGDVGNSIFLPDLDDVSSNHGVRCEGCGTGSGGHVDITELEWNTPYYKDRGGSYVDLGGVVHGKCVVDIAADIDMIGSLADGTMEDSSHGGHSGFFLAEIHGYALNSLGASPNVVLLHAGTNNMDLDVDVETAPGLVQGIIDEILERLPDTTVIVAKIIWANDDPRMQANKDAFNVGIEELVTENERAGKHVLLADMSRIITSDDLKDRKYPNDKGYRKMATVWLDAIQVGIERGWILNPKEPSETDGVGLGKGPGSGPVFNCEGGNWEKIGTIFDSFRTWEELGTLMPTQRNGRQDKVILADLNGDGLTDYILADDDGSVRLREKIRIEDMDGDGYADYVILYSGGAIKWARNTHNNGKDPSKGNWEEPVTIATGLSGVPPDTTRLRGLDGDGKVDYVIVYDDGAVRAHRNTWNLNKDNVKRTWEDWGTIAPGVSGITGDMIRFSDIDGDGRADFLAILADGSVRAWRNLGIIPDKIKSIRFGDLNGDRRADIIFVDQARSPRAPERTSQIPELSSPTSTATDWRTISLSMEAAPFLNNGNIPDRGSGRNWQEGLTISPRIKGVPGDKVHFADITGDGRADFLVIWDGGAVTAYLNNGNIPPKPGTRIWQDGYSVATGVGEPGSKVRFADITGDRRAEYLIVYDGGAVKSCNNTGNIPDVGEPRNWFAMGVITAGVSPQGPVRFADINGDGKADYLTVFEDGHVNGHINTCSWKSGI
ncbi:hypothetical protein DL771_002077 [Monosporascus sp. 5C6A]|nr:hypothetical protein DL771_002077 [Monosporascus sp. 5C6A]